MSLGKFISPIVRWTSPFWGAVASGLYAYKNGGDLSVDIITSPASWAWFLGVIFGYIIHDLTQKDRDNSFLWTAWDNRKNPLSFQMGSNSMPMPDGHNYTTVGAIVFNAAVRKRKNVCVVARQSRGCSTQQRTDIEFCMDIAVQTKVFLPMFEIRITPQKSEFRVVPDYLKSGINSEWCDMTEAAFMFKPCFSDEMNQEKCLRLCTVAMPSEIHNDIRLLEDYYAEDEEEQFLIA